MKVRRSSDLMVFLRSSKIILNSKSTKRLPFSLRFRACFSSQANTGGSVVTAKNDMAVTKDVPTTISTQIRAVASLLAQLVKANSPNIQSSLTELSKRIPFSLQTKSDNISSSDRTAQDGKGIPSYLDVMRPSKKEIIQESIPLWKVKRKTVSQESVDGRTRHVVSSVAKAITKPSLLVRLEDFCQHLIQYPQAKSLAAREGAVSILLRLKHSIPRDELIQRHIREGLALLGYTEALPAKGIRILSIDGGGTRGLLALRILRHIEEKVGRPIYESFDFICGVSTGAILALLIGASKKSIDEVEAMYREISTEVFRQDRSAGLGGLLWSHAYYDSDKWEKILQDKVGEMTMIRTAREPRCPKVAAISSIVNKEVLRPFVFRNYTLPFRVQSQYNGTFHHKMWEAARASSAAPGYFSEFKLGENIHQDGGLFVNNPCAVAIHEAKCIWPDAKLHSVVSVGTGRCQPLDMATTLDGVDPTATSLKQKLSKVIDSATDTERVHTVLHDLLPPKVYFRFNPYLSEIHSLDETDPDRWQRMLDDVDMYIRKNHRKLDEASSTLRMPRSAYKKMQDWITERKFLMQNTMFY